MLLTTKDLTRTFPSMEHPALDHASLDLAKGQILCLAGESGSGKSTLLRILAGLDVPDHGQVILDGKIITDGQKITPPEKREIGMVFQDYALFPHMTVQRNIAFGLKHLSRKARTERVEEMLDLIHMPDLGKRFPHELSGGQCQRVALARAMAPKPKLMLFDEAFCSLDRQMRGRVLLEVRRMLHEAGITAICVTHDIADALHIADQLAILRLGKLLQVGTPLEIYDQPLDNYVAGFFGETNLLSAERSDDHWKSELGLLPDGVADHLSCQTATFSLRPHDIDVVEEGGTKVKVLRLSFHGHCMEAIVSPIGHELERLYRLHLPLSTTIREEDTIHIQPDFSRIRSMACPCSP